MTDHNFDPNTEEKQTPQNDPDSGENKAKEQNEGNNDTPPLHRPDYGQQPYFGAPQDFGTGGETPPQKPKSNKKWIIALAVLYFALVAGLVALIGSGALTFDDTNSDESPVGGGSVLETEEDRSTWAPIEENKTGEGHGTIVGEDYSGESLSASQLYEKNVTSVVFVKAGYRQGYSTGSGFVIDSKNGYILTNYHVVEESAKITVTFADEKEYEATLVGGDEINDIAVLKIDAKDLVHVTVGNSDDLKVGDDILVIGNPLGDLTFTLTRGIVSGTDREINTGEYTIHTFQTDAAINSGNSGGPAFDATGAVVGIASAKYSATGVEGIGFCIPMNDAMEIARDLVDYGYVKGRPNFGITVSDYVDYQYSIDENGRRVVTETTGAKVEEVGKGSCAEKGGLRAGDIVIKLGEKTVGSASKMINLKNTYKAGDTVKLEVIRGNQNITLSITLDEYSPE